MKQIKFFLYGADILFDKMILETEDYNLLSPECTFEIVINDKLFFRDEYFCILEYWKQLCSWKTGNNFHYRSLECDDSILSFEKVGANQYKIYSPWQLFECDKPFSFEELQASLYPQKEHTGDDSVC